MKDKSEQEEECCKNCKSSLMDEVKGMIISNDLKKPVTKKFTVKRKVVKAENKWGPEDMLKILDCVLLAKQLMRVYKGESRVMKD